MRGRRRARGRAIGVGALVIGLVACGADGTATGQGPGARTGPTEPAADAFTRPLSPGATVPLNGNVITVAPGDSPHERERDLAILRTVSSVAVAPDGSVVVADGERGRIVRFGPDGGVSLVAGTDRLASTGDGGPATEASVQPRAVAVGPDATIWVSDAAGLRHIDAAGTISMVVPYASGGEAVGPEVLAGVSATQAPLVAVGALTVGSDGRPILAIWRSAYRLEVDLTLTHLAGGSGDEVGEGGPATAAGFTEIRAIASRADGSLLLLDRRARLVRSVSPEGIITTLGGPPPTAIDDRVGPFEEAPSGIAVGPGGSALVSVQPTGELVRVGPGEMEVISANLTLPSELATFADGTVVVGSATGVLTRVGT